MKISLNWIKQFTDIAVSTDDLIKLATERLGGIESVTDLSRQYEGIVVARVVTAVKHPNADKLSLCKIDDGGAVKDVDRDENGYVQVVCGAPNVREGLLVAWVPPGAIVPASFGEKELFVLEARDLRGEVSNGMLASPAELGLSDDHTGILEIETNARVKMEGETEEKSDSQLRGKNDVSGQGTAVIQPGTPFKDLYDLDDTIIEIENKMFTHRPDGFGHLGVAREIAGIQHVAFHSPQWYINPQLPTGESNVHVTIESPELSERYMAVEFKDVVVKPSPLWLQSYLKRVGIRPINNIVDITNYIMMLTAQPVHAFDFEKIATNANAAEADSARDQVAIDGSSVQKVEISIRRPKDGEKLTLLDGKVITPHADATLICNPNGPIALAGVMGGGNSEIDESTTRVVLECATFNMYNIRKTSMIHGLFTEAATRLTKGQPAAQLPSVLTKAIELFETYAHATVVGAPADATSVSSDKQAAHNYIEIDTRFINDRLGSKFTDEEIVTLLNNVEIQAHVASGPIEVRPPFWRTDLEIKEDIVEEIGRLYGFNQLPLVLPRRTIAPVTPEQSRALKTEIRRILSRSGANEVLTYSFVHGDLLKKAGQDPARAFALRNALSPDLQYYRLSILPSLLEKVRTNIKAGFNEFVLFEIGKTHTKYADDSPENLPDETNMLEMVYTSEKQKSGAAYYQMLQYVDALLSGLGISYRIQPISQEIIENPEKKIQAEKPFNMSRSAYIFYKDAEAGGLIGVVGELEQSVITAFKLPPYTAAALFALDGASFETENRNLAAYMPLSKYPSSEQDITLKVAADAPFAALQTLLASELAETEYNHRIEPLGVYQKEGEPTKNISFRIVLSHFERTLTTKEVSDIIAQFSWQAHQQLQAEQV